MRQIKITFNSEIYSGTEVVPEARSEKRLEQILDGFKKLRTNIREKQYQQKKKVQEYHLVCRTEVL
jgi:hypothetical protein